MFIIISTYAQIISVKLILKLLRHVSVCVALVRSKQEFTPDRRNTSTHTHTQTNKPNQELHMRPHLPRFHHKDTLLYFILLF